MSKNGNKNRVWVQCSECNGRGQVIVATEITHSMRTCRRCKGYGGYWVTKKSK